MCVPWLTDKLKQCQSRLNIVHLCSMCIQSMLESKLCGGTCGLAVHRVWSRAASSKGLGQNGEAHIQDIRGWGAEKRCLTSGVQGEGTNQVIYGAVVRCNTALALSINSPDLCGWCEPSVHTIEIIDSKIYSLQKPTRGRLSVRCLFRSNN